ncbi:uncharacterized protein I206_100467 [Kwoniella pini CBS 10737]|uniref:Myb-like domain-containing protein n=1 Tax=Kwoniella pini CBS 10737 TaxID=1296096 RepID=A0A1B9IDJ7_9TREE|nr:uncharacterized protein I206_00862 [Kwoniella pini CBS 10737]OCF53557.1 hypothetical protein I206_00862 [Kwoniella pini CBS 10737]
MKRSYTSSPESSSPNTSSTNDKPTQKELNEIKPKLPSTPIKNKKIKQSNSISTPKKNNNQGIITPNSSPWTPDKKEKFLEKIFTLGLKACNNDEICQEFDLTKVQFNNATQAGKKGNLRDKACKGIRGD